MSFPTLGLPPVVYSSIARLGYTEPTPVQTQAIPVVLTGADLVARAQTGTGKTAAFGLPMMARLLAAPRPSNRRSPRALVLVPTRELALQVHRSLASYAPAGQISVTAIFGGVGMGPQVKALARGTDIIVATPGRLLDHLQRRTVSLAAASILVLDEADRMLDMGFLPALRRIVAELPRERQSLLFSATLPTEVMRLAGDFTREAVHVDVSDGNPVAATVTHRVHPVGSDRKAALLAHVLAQDPARQTLVFCRTKRGSDRVGEHLTRTGIKAAVIHGNKSQGARTRALGDFKSGRVTTLVATDIAARGLDIAQLPLVVNYDLPLVPSDYIHRVGRTGRAGHSGSAISLVSSAELPLLRDIQRLLTEPVEQVAVDGFTAAFDRHPVSPAPTRPGRGGRRGDAPSPSRGRSRFPSRRQTGYARQAPAGS